MWLHSLSLLFLGFENTTCSWCRHMHSSTPWWRVFASADVVCVIPYDMFHLSASIETMYAMTSFLVVSNPASLKGSSIHVAYLINALESKPDSLSHCYCPWLDEHIKSSQYHLTVGRYLLFLQPHAEYRNLTLLIISPINYASTVRN
jgi:hypothetical protein